MSQTDRVTGLSTSTSIKVPVKVAAISNITLSGEQTIDGVAVVADDRVLVTGQTDGTENGIYLVRSGAWVRSADFDGARDVAEGTLVWVAQGTVYGDTFFQVTNANPITIGTTSLTFNTVNGAFTGTFTSSASGAVARSVTSKFEDIISVKDFGAVGSGNEATEFQATVDALPSHGGMILVPDGDYSATTGVTKGSTQEIVWLGWNATLPAGLPGTAIDLGRFATFIVAGESSRNGLIAHRVRLGDREVPANEIDRVYHVEATMPTDAGISTQRELIAYSFLLETDHHEPNGGDIRGVKGIVRGDGGQANIRAAHFLAQGYNSHTGDVTGVLSDVFHSDKVTGANDPVGKSYCFLAQVGPGMASGYELRSSLRTDDNSNPGAKERPNYGYRVQEGANAVLPEIACFQGHGGGNGDIFRGLASDTDSTVVFSVDNEGRVLGKAYRSGHQSIANEGTHVITPPDESGFLEVYAEGTTQAFGKVFYRAGASPSCVEVYGGTAFGVSTADLTGTTGTPGDLTVSAKSDGNIEIENQTGSARTVVWFFMSRE